MQDSPSVHDVQKASQDPLSHEDYVFRDIHALVDDLRGGDRTSFFYALQTRSSSVTNALQQPLTEASERYCLQGNPTWINNAVSIMPKIVERLAVAFAAELDQETKV